MSIAALAALQTELLALKTKFGRQLRLKKGSGEDAPFPIVATYELSPPEAASRYDVGDVRLLMTISGAALDASEGGFAVEVLCDELPQPLRSLIASSLLGAWKQARSKASGFCLAVPIDHITSHFVDLITALPALLEPYQSVDGNGSTVRRFAILTVSDEEAATTSATDIATTSATASDTSSASDTAPVTVSATPATSATTLATAAASATVVGGSSTVVGGSGTSSFSEEVLSTDLLYFLRRYRDKAFQQVHPQASGGPAGSQSALADATATGLWALPVAFSLQLTPTDPAWEFGSMVISGKLRPSILEPGNYSVSLQVVPNETDNKSPPAWICSSIELEMNAQLPQAGLRSVVKQVENYGGLFVDAAWRDRVSGTLGVADDELAADEVLDDDGYASCSDESIWSGSSEGGDGSDDDVAPVVRHAQSDEVAFSGHAELGGPADSTGGTGVPLSYSVQLEGLSLDCIAALELVRASFQVACSRCGELCTLSVSSSAISDTSGGPSAAGGTPSASSTTAPAVKSGTFESSTECAKCHVRVGIQARPRFVHESSNVLCILRPAGCVPLDLLPSMFAAQCNECNCIMSLKSVQVGVTHERGCSACHRAMTISFSAVSFKSRSPTAGGPVQGGASKAKGCALGAARRGARVQDVLQEGMPLPMQGACKHYRHSYRWLRFPCCGTRYACDLCHEEAADHDAVWATRMVCGFCSVEQPVFSQCRGCGKKLARSAANASGKNTRFWEGGKGCRDTGQMNRNDSHRFRGKNKTKSAKHTRVGPKAYTKELKKIEKSEAE